MEKLTLEHLAPYLPYGLKFYHFDDERGIRSICEFSSINVDEIILVNSYYEYVHSLKDSEVIPIFRPMSDLTRSMLENAGFDSHIDYLTHELQSEGNSGRLDSKGRKLWRIEHAPYEMVAYLFREHFDVFGLLAKDLAISIHDVKEAINE